MKRNILPTLLGVLILLSTATYAADFIPEPIENFFVFLFEALPEGVQGDELFAIAFFKFLLWIAVFAVMYSALKKAFSGENNVVIAISLIMSLAGVLLIPNAFIIVIFELYAILISILIIVLPLLLVWFLNKKLFGNGENGKMHGWAKGLVYIGVAILITFFSVALAEATLGTGIYGELGRWMEIAAIILLFMGIIMFFEEIGDTIKGPGKGGIYNPKKGEEKINDLNKFEVAEINDERKVLEHLEKLDEIQNYLIGKQDSLDAGLLDEEKERKKILRDLKENYAIQFANLLKRFAVFRQAYENGQFKDSAKAKEYIEQYEQRLQQVGELLENLTARLLQLVQQGKKVVDAEIQNDKKEEEVEKEKIHDLDREIDDMKQQEKIVMKKVKEAKKNGDGVTVDKSIKDVKQIEQVLSALKNQEKQEKKKRKDTDEMAKQEKKEKVALTEEEKLLRDLWKSLKFMEQNRYQKIGSDFFPNIKALSGVETDIEYIREKAKELHDNLKSLDRKDKDVREKEKQIIKNWAYENSKEAKI